jgi:predicted amidophosphoribosyltransferase
VSRGPLAPLRAVATDLRRGLLDLFLPRACARCQRRVPGDVALCPPCARALPRLLPGGCPLCQSQGARRGERCGACRRARLGLDQIAAEAPFEGEVASFVHRFKYPAPGLAGLDPRPAVVVAALLADAACRLAGRPPELLVPVPIHPRRLRERGLHPAGVLALGLARATDVGCELRALEAVRVTASQTGLDRAQRRRNVEGAFAVRPGFAAPPCVALVDDVVTTGATLAACARALRRAGARRVVAVCAARTV